MQRIYKYILNLEDKQYLRIDHFVKVLSVKEQRDKIVLYALIDDNYNDNILTIRIIGTGHEIQENAADYTFADTVSMRNGEFMWHVFYRVEKISYS